MGDAQHLEEPAAPSPPSPLRRIPADAWDSHMHIVDLESYPLSAHAVYTPQASHRLPDALAFEHSVGLRNIVVVQPSFYGTDNRCLLDVLRLLGPRRARGVVVLAPPEVGASAAPPPPAALPDAATLRAWHDAGVRGVRVNLVSVSRFAVPSAAQLEALLRPVADVAAPLGWVLQIFVPSVVLDVLEPLVPRLGVRVVLDHLGQPVPPEGETALPADDPYRIPGFAALIRMLRAGQTFVKLSAPYRISKEGGPRYADLDPVIKEVLRVAGRSRVVFATDWPHTRFEGLDVRPWVERVLELCGDDEELVERVFRGNAEDLWGVRRDGEAAGATAG